MNLEEALPLLSAWGLAIENKQDTVEPYANLMKLNASYPEIFKEAVDTAEAFQNHFVKNPPAGVSEDSLEHPKNRLMRVLVLQQHIR